MDIESLLAWYGPRRRRYPWRRARPDPYRVLVSEVMLQQTQAARVVPAFRAFVATFPSVAALAAAPRRDVLRAWAGLGYNRRAVWLAETSRRIVQNHGGKIPSDPDALALLPGIGPYTAAAVASIAFGVPVPAVDTNVRRVVARAVLGLDEQEASPRAVRHAAAEWITGSDPADWNQAVMDLGREVCRPMPRCERCPLMSSCAYRAGGRPSGRRAPVDPRGGDPFEGSFRQLRGAIVRLLRDRGRTSLASLAGATSQPLGRVADAVSALQADGLVTAGPAAARGSPSGRVRLSD